MKEYRTYLKNDALVCIHNSFLPMPKDVACTCMFLARCPYLEE